MDKQILAGRALVEIVAIFAALFEDLVLRVA